MKKIFYGGTFDPIHNGHIGIALSALKRFPDAEVLLAPAPIPPHKNVKEISAFDLRLQMVQTAAAGYPGIVPCDVEKDRAGKSYTYDTLHILQEKYPEAGIMLLIGGDSLLQLHTWHCTHELVKEFEVIVYPRPGEDISEASLAANWSEAERMCLLKYVLKNVPLFSVSSTAIRQMICKGNFQQAAEFLPAGILSFIREKRLYLREI